MALEIIACDSGEEMWRDLEKRFQEEEATLLLPGNFARSQFLSSLRDPIFGDRRVMTLLEFWDYLGVLTGEGVDYLASELEVEVLREVKKDFPHLSLLEDDALFSLASHIREIEEESDQSFQATDSVEAEIDKLRALLLEQGIRFQGAWRSRVARLAKNVSLDRPLIIPHLPEASRQLGGMIAGVSYKNAVFYYPLLRGETLRHYLETIGISAEGRIREDEKRRDLSLLFEEDDGSSDRDLSFLSTSDEVELSLARALDLYHKGEKRIALVSSGGEIDRRRITEKAREHGIPLLFRDEARAQDTLLGSIFLLLVEKRELLQDKTQDTPEEDTLDDVATEIIESAKPIYALSREDIWDLPGDDQAFLQSLFALGERMLQESEASLTEHLWFTSFQKKWQTLKEAGFSLGDLKTFIAETTTPRQAYGRDDGILLLSPAEVANYKIDHLIFFRLGAGDYPKEPTPSPFFSEELLEENPLLLAKDERFEFLADLLSADKSITLIRDSRKDPSAYYNKALRFFAGQEEYAESDLTRRVIADRARKRLAAHKDIESALERIGGVEDFDFAKLSRKTSFSVTEIENYLACPLRWFVQHQLKPKSLLTMQQRRGTALHNVLEELLAYPVEERSLLLREVLDKHTEDFLSPRQRNLDFDSLEYILKVYASASWPFSEHVLEKSFSIEEDFSGDLIEITGRIDRIDLSEGKALLIDYKSNKASVRKDDLQISLYPLMVARSMEVEPVGFLYISLFQGRHFGHLTHEIDGISSDGIDYRFNPRAGIQKVEEAIGGIRSGDWFRTGEKCPDWCSHHVLSATGDKR